MSRQPTISIEAQVLLKLLRLALGTETIDTTVDPFPDNVNWKEIIRLTYGHKISALAFDGFKISGFDISKTSDSTPGLNTLTESWCNNATNIEKSYAYYTEVLKTLCHIFANNGLKTIILKGYGLSLNYPLPSHRGTGDIDIFLLDRNNKSAAKIGDTILSQQLGLKVNREEEEKHSVCVFKGVTIENHYRLREGIIKSKSEIEYLSFLNEQVNNGIVKINGIDAFQPSASINCLLLLRHMLGDQSDSGITLRQICDWAMFLRENSAEIDIELISAELNKAGFDEYFFLLNSIVSKWLNVRLPVSFCHFIDKNNMADLLLEDIIYPVNWGRTYIDHIKYYKKRNNVNHLLLGKGWINLSTRALLRHLIK